MTLEEKRIDHLYRLLDFPSVKRDLDLTAAIRWAIFELECMYSHSGGERP